MRLAAHSISETADLLLISTVYKELSENKIPSEWQFLGENVLLILEVKEEWSDCFELNRRQ